jgi:hypothetical protein
MKNERLWLFEKLKMIQLNSERTDMAVALGKIDWIIIYNPLIDGEEIEFYFGNN